MCLTIDSSSFLADWLKPKKKHKKCWLTDTCNIQFGWWLIGASITTKWQSTVIQSSSIFRMRTSWKDEIILNAFTVDVIANSIVNRLVELIALCASHKILYHNMNFEKYFFGFFGMLS
jgi:hypothetical protein